jgi:Ribbon-helix-helix protein, copG family
MKQTAFRLDEDLLGALQAIKRRDGIPLSEQVRRALQAWVEQKGVVKLERKRAATRRRP